MKMKSSVRVLYVHHCGIFGGSSRSLCETIRVVTQEGVEASVLTPNGNVVERFRAAGADVITCRGISQWDNTRYSHYRGVRWLVLMREISYLPSTLLGLWRAKRRWPGVNIVHVNEITAVVPAVVAQWLFRCPVIMHARAVWRTTTESLRSRLITRILRRVVARIVAIDDTVARSLPISPQVVVIHNGFAPDNTPGSSEPLDQTIEQALGGSRLKVAMVGNLLTVKGVREFVQAAKVCRERGVESDFVLVGANIRQMSRRARIIEWAGLNQDSGEWVVRYIRENGLGDRVHLVGALGNIGAVYKRIDVLCFPSYLDAPGRPVFEAAFFGVPSILAINRPTSDSFVHGETGLAVAAQDVTALADAIQFFHDHPEERRRMGETARKLAEQNFNPRRNTLKLIRLYESLLSGRSRTLPGISSCA